MTKPAAPMCSLHPSATTLSRSGQGGSVRSTAVIRHRYDFAMGIRQARLADAEAIAVIHVRSWQAAYQGLVPQEFLDRMEPAQRRPVWEALLTEASWPRRTILVAEVDGRVAGFASLGPTRDHDEDPATTAEVAAIYLAPEVWGQGMGKQLMAAALETFADAGYEQATLWVLDTNAQARRFYEADGWHTDGAEKRDDTRGFPTNEIRYRRTII